MKERIQQELNRIAKFHGVQIIHAVESGSRVWGFASKDSDWDVRFIYLRSPEWYLSIDPRRDVIEIPLLPGDLDISGWDLPKALRLMHKSNPPLMEWLTSPIVYETTGFAKEMLAVGMDCFSQRTAIHHYLHMADGNYRGYLSKGTNVWTKKYFYVLRPLLACRWIERFGGMPPVVFSELLSVADWSGSLADSVMDLLELKMEGKELGQGPRIPALNHWIEGKLSYYEAYARTKAQDKGTFDNLNALFQKALYPEVRSRL